VSRGAGSAEACAAGIGWAGKHPTGWTCYDHDNVTMLGKLGEPALTAEGVLLPHLPFAPCEDDCKVLLTEDVCLVCVYGRALRC
jgi:hypothetical protein